MSDDAELERLLRKAANRKAPGFVGAAYAYLERRLRRARALPPEQRGPDVAAFLESVQLLREQHKLLPLTRKGSPTLPATPATAKRAVRGMLLHMRAQLISPLVPVSEVQVLPHERYLRLVRKVRQAAMWTTGREGLPDLLLETVLVSHIAQENGCEFESLPLANRNAAFTELPANEAALRTALQQHTITGSSTPLLTLEQLQLACHHQVIHTTIALQARHVRLTHTLPHGGMLDMVGMQAKALTPAQQSAVEAARQRSIGAILRIAPDSPKSQQAAARALMHSTKEYATLVQHCLACHDLAVRSNDGFFTVWGAVTALISAAGGLVLVPLDRKLAALAAFQRCGDVLQRCRSMLPELWASTLQSLHDKAQSFLPSLEGQLQILQRADWRSEADVRSAAFQLRDLNVQAFQQSATAGAPMQQMLFCAGCEQPSVGMRRCERCRTPYCSPACFRKHWPVHKLVCKPVAGSTSGNSMAAADPAQPSASPAPAPALLPPKPTDSKRHAASCQAPIPSPLASSGAWNRGKGPLAAAEPPAASSIFAGDKAAPAAAGGQFSPTVGWASQPLDRTDACLLLGLLLLLGLVTWLLWL